MQRSDLKRTGRARGFRKLSGLDRSGPPPVETGSDQPWRLWTLPNFIGYVRLGLIPPFLILALNSGDGRRATATLLAGIAGFSDYFDGIAARATGQYSRFGALLDPLVDRLLIIAVAGVALKYDLMPHTGVILLLAREAWMLLMSVPSLLLGGDIHVNWLGRIAVWPIMLSGFIALMIDSWVTGALLYGGLVLAYAATLLYARDMIQLIKNRKTAHVQASTGGRG